MLAKFSNFVKLSHTIFAMPFAMIGYSLALSSSEAVFEWQLFLKICLAMVFARNTAMGFNRWADRKIDAANPRTATREIPAGIISARAALVFIILNAVLFMATASTINFLSAALSPLALLIIMGYSYFKRFSALAHLVLGLSLAIAPIGAYIAATGHFAPLPCLLSFVVLTWCAGFDIIYALQDRDYDIQNGLHSIPSRFSIAGALRISIALHFATAAALIAFAYLVDGAWWRWIGVGLFVALLAAQHILVRPDKVRNIPIAFATLNGIASLLLAAFVITALFL